MTYTKGQRKLVEMVVFEDGPDEDGDVTLEAAYSDGCTGLATVAATAVRPWSHCPQPVEPPVGSLARVGNLRFSREESGDRGWYEAGDWYSWQDILDLAAECGVKVEVRTPDDIWGKKEFGA